MRCALASILIIAAAAGCQNRVAPRDEDGPLRRSFRLAAAESGVPEEVLLAVGYVESRWRMHDAVIDDEHGRGAQGLMGIVDRPDQPRLASAARALGIDPADARAVPEDNVRTAAEALRVLAAGADGNVPKVLRGWHDALARYGADDDVAGGHYADEVLRVIDVGAEGDASTGEHLVLSGRGKASAQQVKTQALSTDSPYAVRYLEARYDHWHAGRAAPVDRIVLHTTEGSYDGAIGWFRSAINTRLTSAHYVIRSSDGEITQMVHEQDTAFHVLNWNERAIGIEHEAVADEPGWFTEAMMQSSARLVRDICRRWGIPMDRAHIVGHSEVPGNNHTDPGPYFDWDHYMALVTGGADDAPPPPATDPCDGLSYAGACDGTVLQWCEGGGVRSVDCAQTPRPSCGWQDDTVGNNCLAESAPPAPPPPPPPPPEDPCHGLDFAGACDGSVLSWCEGGAVRSVDCATTALPACGWQDDAVGNNCIAPPPPPPDPCGGLDYAGTCDGSTLEWCEDGAPQSFDCASTGQRCGWQSDSVGNNCLL